MDQPELRNLSGGCHCGKVRYDVKLDLGAPVISCNCSMCGRAGTLLTFVPEEQFTLRSGAEHLTEYLFNKHRIHHAFCQTCGIKSFARGVGADGKKMVAINARCIDDVDLERLQIKKFDGKSK